MSKRSSPILFALALGASAAGVAQTPTDMAFTATGTNCADVTWSKATLAQYPHIAEACQGVVERDGKYYVKFSGDVRNVADRGRSLTVDFKNGERVTLNPPENMSIDVNGKKVAVRDLRSGDTLNFYVPQSRLAVQFPEGDPLRVSVPIRVARAEPERAALVPGAKMSSSAPQLPKTASELPAIGLCGLLLTALGATLTGLRRLSRAS
jgi:hypothetical protein